MESRHDLPEEFPVSDSRALDFANTEGKYQEFREDALKGFLADHGDGYVDGGRIDREGFIEGWADKVEAEAARRAIGWARDVLVREYDEYDYDAANEVLFDEAVDIEDELIRNHIREYMAPNLRVLWDPSGTGHGVLDNLQEEGFLALHVLDGVLQGEGPYEDIDDAVFALREMFRS